MFKNKPALIVLGISISLVLVEIILRIAGFGYTVFYGLRHTAISGKHRVFCVGESTTYGFGAQDPATQNYPKVLEKMLSERYGDGTVSVVYDLTIGQNSSEALRRLPAYIKKYTPEVIIIMCGANNWWNLDKSNILLFNKDGRISNYTLRSLIFLDQFRVWKLFKWLRWSFGRGTTRWNYRFPEIPEGETTMYLWHRYARQYGDMGIFNKIANYDILEMVKICKRNGIKVIICSYPVDDDDRITADKEIAARFSAVFVDISALFKNLPIRKDYFWKDDWHPNEKGYRLMAERIYSSIVTNNLLGIESS